VRFAKITLTSLATGARALLGQLRGLGSEASDASAEPYDDAELLQPLGLVARPTRTSNLQALLIELGEELVGLLLRDKGLAAWTDVEEGETRLYSNADATCRVRLRADGSIDIEAKAGANLRIATAGGGNVVINGGTSGVARNGDAVNVTLTALQIGTIVAPAGGGPCTGGPITINGSINGVGAANFKA
jgi:hypothetical protein